MRAAPPIAMRSSPLRFIACFAHSLNVGLRMSMLSDASIRTLREPCRHEQYVGAKNKFVAIAAPVVSAEAALEFVRSNSDPKARHNVFAWRLADGATRTNGDGEPGGTAGPPVLAAIAGAELADVVVVVSRYRLGEGAKLGTGGLVRAYGGTATRCLDQAEIVQVDPQVRARAVFGPEDTGSVYALLGALSPIIAESGDAGTALEAQLDVSPDEIDQLSEALRGATQGRVSLEILSGADGDGAAPLEMDAVDTVADGKTTDRGIPQCTTVARSDRESPQLRQPPASPPPPSPPPPPPQQQQRREQSQRARDGKRGKRQPPLAPTDQHGPGRTTKPARRSAKLHTQAAPVQVPQGDGQAAVSSFPGCCAQCSLATEMLFQDDSDRQFYCGACWRAYFALQDQVDGE